MEIKNNTRLYGMLGFAMRAGRVIIGTEIVCSSMSRRGKDAPKLVLVSFTASAGTKKKVLTKSEFYHIDCIVIDIDSGELGRLLGKTYAPTVIAITDERFADEIKRAIGSDNQGGDQ